MQAQMIKAYVDQTFDKYDTDKSGTLDEDELTNFFNDLFKTLGLNTTVTRQQSLEAIKSIDANSDGSVDKQQLFDAFMKMLNSPPAQHMTQSSSPPGYSPYYGNYPNSNMSMSYPSHPQYPPHGYNGYANTCNEYGMENPFSKNPQYPPPPPQYNPNYPHHPPQYNPNYYQPNQGGYQPHYPQQYQPQYQGGYPQQFPYGNNPYMNKGNFGSPGSKWGGKK